MVGEVEIDPAGFGLRKAKCSAISELAKRSPDASAAARKEMGP